MTVGYETCCHLLTPSGTGAIAVIRLAGPRAEDILRRTFHSADIETFLRTPAGRIAYGQMRDSSFGSLDDVLVARVGDSAQEHNTAFDITTHGGIRVVERIIDLLQGYGAAYSTVKDMSVLVRAGGSLIEREITRALCHAQTERAVRFLAHQRVCLIPAIEAAAARCETDPEHVRRTLHAMTHHMAAARVLLRGIRIALVGPPNSGKSTLFNRLCGRPTAIVSPGAGTTRDWVCENIELQGAPVELVDTAGSRVAGDELEQAAIIAGRAQANRADILLIMLDGTRRLSETDTKTFLASQNMSQKKVLVLNKLDLVAKAMGHATSSAGEPAVALSAKRGDGVDDLLSSLASTVGVSHISDAQPCLFTGRQKRAVNQAIVTLNMSPGRAAELLRTDLIGE